jgi:hypothetical protein
MRYNLELRSIARENESIPAKHSRFLEGLAGIPAPWGLRSSMPAPDPGSALNAYLKLSKLVGPEIKGEVVYQFRRPFSNKASDDDWVNSSFNPAKVSLEEIAYVVFPRYIAAFDAYYAEISDDEFIFLDYPERSRRKIETRNSLFRLPPIAFLDAGLCSRALNKTIEQVVEKLTGKVEKVEELHGGVFIILSSKPQPTDVMDKVCWAARALLDE